MKPSIKALRAVGSRYAYLVLKPIAIVVTLVLLVLIAIVVALSVKVSAWWLIFMAPLLIIGIPLVAALLAARLVVNALAPPMDAAQRTAVNEFIEKMQGVSEGLQTPQFIIIFRIVRDVLMKKGEDGFVYKMTVDSTTLKKDFNALTKLFAEG